VSTRFLGALLVLVISAIYLAAQPELYRLGLVKLFPPRLHAQAAKNAGAWPRASLRQSRGSSTPDPTLKSKIAVRRFVCEGPCLLGIFARLKGDQIFGGRESKNKRFRDGICL
jgi:hypothetical protein